MNQDDRELIAQQVECIADDIRKLPNNPFRPQLEACIKDLF